MNEKRYSEFMSEIKAPDDTVDKAVEAMYNSITPQVQNVTFKPKHRGYRSIAAMAAVMCLVMLAGVLFYPFGSKGDNIFAINVGAAEVNSYELTKPGEMNCKSNSLGLGFNEENEVISITAGEILDFSVECTGEKIEKLTYELQGDGFFYLPQYSPQVYDKVYFEESSVLLPYVNTSVQYTDGGKVYLEKVRSFTTDYSNQETGAKLYLYSSDDNGYYCEKYNDTLAKESDGNAYGKGFDHQQMYYDMFSSADHLVKITATFEDGTTLTKTLELVIEKADTQSYTDNHSTLIVSAKIAE